MYTFTHSINLLKVFNYKMLQPPVFLTQCVCMVYDDPRNVCIRIN